MGLKLTHVSKGAMINNQRPLSNCITSEFCIRNLHLVLTTWTTLPRNACEHCQWYSMEVQLCIVISDIIIGMYHIIFAFLTLMQLENHCPPMGVYDIWVIGSFSSKLWVRPKIQASGPSKFLKKCIDTKSYDFIYGFKSLKDDIKCLIGLCKMPVFLSQKIGFMHST